MWIIDTCYRDGCVELWEKGGERGISRRKVPYEPGFDLHLPDPHQVLGTAGGTWGAIRGGGMCHPHGIRGASRVPCPCGEGCGGCHRAPDRVRSPALQCRPAQRPAVPGRTGTFPLRRSGGFTILRLVLSAPAGDGGHRGGEPLREGAGHPDAGAA